MQINVSITISNKELLNYVSEAINKAHKYSSNYQLATGEAKSMRLENNQWCIEWGDRPEEPIKPALTYTPASAEELAAQIILKQLPKAS